ncbi:hypothetical protein Lal_00039146 [Lupinus albus]|uniref:Uncharacterized protein n=1 Tax=Lupinus albus TaxID=3870 RepID=A0A6A5NDK4_LUPAL|nr:hypothetical protein Lalb_Chr20g0121591 [Lupinus albus]KAF1882498.1 hypothetical protein Lal_00039146 [Lupinus albus]
MAPFSTYISFLFLATLLFPLQVIARESNFFSKVAHSNNNVEETEVPKEEEPEKKPDEQPVFIPETENSYGLYGHESTQTPSTTNTNYEPHETEFQHTSKYPNKYHHNYNNDDAYNSNQNEELDNTRFIGTYRNNYNNKDVYEGNQNELSDTKYTEGEYNSVGNQHNYKNHYYNNNAANDNRYNDEKQGMSDTRFLEGGRYFYDVKYEKYNPTLYDDSSRGVNTHNNMYNNRGNNYYGNNNGYQNQEDFEDEQDFEP